MPTVHRIIDRIAHNDAPGTERLLTDALLQDRYPAAIFQPATSAWEAADGEWPLTVFAGKHRAAATMALLLERGVPVPDELLDEMLLRMSGAKPVEAAVRAVRHLVGAGADGSKPGPVIEGKNGFSPLTAAALGGNREVLEVLVEAGVPLDSTDALGRTALSAALTIFGGQKLPCLEMILESGAPLDVPNADGELPLDLAVKTGSFEAVLMLLRYGSPLTERFTPERVARLTELAEAARQIETRGGPPTDMFQLLAKKEWDLIVSMAEVGMSLEVWHSYHGFLWSKVFVAAPLETQLRLMPTLEDRLALMHSVVRRASGAEGLVRLETALALVDDLNAPTETASVLGSALRANAPEEALDMLLARGADVHGARAGWTPAHDAARNAAGLAWLKAHGADLDVEVEGRGTPLQIAVEKGAVEAAAFLVADGARQDVTNADGLTPLEVARKKKAKGMEKLFDPDLSTAPTRQNVEVDVTKAARGELQAACAREDATEVRRLIADGADPNALDERGVTPLAVAVGVGATDVVQALVELGADVDRATRNGCTPWAIAKLSKRSGIEKLLVDAGAFDAPVLLIGTGDRMNDHSRFIREGDVAKLAAAIDAGMDVELPLSSGLTPLSTAVASEQDDVVDLLLRAGVDATGRVGAGALRVAQERGHERIVEKLVAAGAVIPPESEDTGVEPEPAAELAPDVVRQLRRLGASVPEGWVHPAELAGAQVPAPLRQLGAVTWPEGVTYGNGDRDQPWVWMLELGGIDALPRDEIRVVHEGPLASIGVADGGNYFLVVRLDDPDPADPVVYSVDHDDPGQTLGGGAPASAFLATLEPERSAPTS